MTQTAATQIPVNENMELGFGAMLLAEGEGGGYEPIGIVSTISEAREIADGDYENRMKQIEKGANAMYPAYRTIFTFEAD